MKLKVFIWAVRNYTPFFAESLIIYIENFKESTKLFLKVLGKCARLQNAGAVKENQLHPTGKRCLHTASADPGPSAEAVQ